MIWNFVITFNLTSCHGGKNTMNNVFPDHRHADISSAFVNELMCIVMVDTKVICNISECMMEIFHFTSMLF